MFFINRSGVLAAFALFALMGKSTAQCTTCDGDVKVDFKGSMCIKGSYTLQLHDKTTDPATGTSCGSYTVSPPLAEKVKLKPDKPYTLTLVAVPSGTDGGLSSVHLEISCPSCYKVYIDGDETSVYEGPGPGCGAGQGLTKTFTVVIKRNASGGSGSAGDGAVSGGSSSNGVSGDFSLGGSSNDSAGSISFSSGTITPDLFTPAVLNYESVSSDVDVIRNSGTNILRQIKAPEVLADIVTHAEDSGLDASTYEIRFYPSAQVGTKAAGVYPVTGDPSGGLYPVSGSPSRIWRFSSPTNSTTTPVIQATEIRGSIQTDWIFSYISGTWTAEVPGVWAEARTETTLTNGDKQIDTTVFHPTTSVTVSKVRDVYHAFPWGTEKISSIQDPGGDALTTSWAYHEDSMEAANYGRLKWVIQPNGSWQRYAYYGDGERSGRTQYVFRPWKDLPASPNDATTTNCHLTTYDYTSASYYSYFKTEVSEVEKFVLGTAVEETYSWYETYNLSWWYLPLFEDYDDMEYSPVILRYDGGYYGRQTATLATTSDVPEYLRGRIAFIQEPDGRQEIHTYERGIYNPSTHAFTQSSTGDHLREYVTSVTLSEPYGINGKTLRTARITGPAGALLEEDMQVKSSSGFVSLTTTLHSYDAAGHLTLTTLNGRTTYEASWSDSRLASETDEQGIATTYDVYDAKGRVTQESRLGVVTNRVYDAVGNLTSSTRSSGGLSLGTAMEYDLCGRVILETSENGLTAETVYADGGRTITRTRADTSTEITAHYLDRRTESVSGTGVVSQYFDYGTDGSGLWSKQYFGSSTSARYSQTWSNEDGEIWLSAVSGPSGPIYTTTTFDPHYVGRVIARTVPGETPILYSYDSDTGALVRQVRDLNSNGTINDDTDSIEQTVTTYVEHDGDWFRKTVHSRFETDGNSTPTVVSTNREQLTGLGSGIASNTEAIDSQGHITTSTTAINRTTRTVTATTDVPDSTIDAVEITIDGNLQSTSTPTVPTPTVYGSYDALGRSTVSTSPTGVITAIAYDATTGNVSSVTRAGKQTSYTYHATGNPGAGNVATETLPDSNVIRTSYTLRGEVFRVWGGATYPFERTYNDYGQQQFLKTYRAGTGWTGTAWPGSPGTADVTEWTYYEATGLLHEKINAASKATTYTYDANGKLHTRERARGPVTTYTWNSLGLPSSVTHGDGTPSAGYTYDRAGRLKTLADAAGNHVFAYPDALTTAETITGGTLDGVTRSISLDTYQRLSSTGVTSGSASHSNEYHYASNSRLDHVTNGNESTTYAYLADSDATETLTFKTSTTTRLTTTRGYDASNRLDSVTNAYGSSQTQSFGVSQFDDLSRRKKITREDGTRWSYGYNGKGEVESGIREKTASPNTAVPGWSHAYSFDEIGNRKTATTNGRVSTYTSNALNQIDERTVPRAFDVIGKASATASVTIDSSAATRLDEYFYKEITTTDMGKIHIPYSVAASDGTGTTSRGGGKFLSATPETFTYDFDGNLTSDGRFTYAWDAENRLIGMEAHTAVPLPARRKLAFAYDATGRRICKTVWQGTSGGGWQLHHKFDFIHELNGWNILAERSGSSVNSFIRTYTWGSDLSGSLNGAGGVGGLLFTKLHASGKTLANGLDLNGNVTLLADMANGQAVATYDYGPFGEPLRQSGEYAMLNPFRFSTKYTDDEIGMLDYGNRYYDPVNGRWLSTDPIKEQGGLNLYGFVGNNGINRFDYLGLTSREDILSGRLVYSTQGGWIDWGHANPSGPRRLWNQILNESGQVHPDLRGFKVGYHQGGGAKVAGITFDALHIEGKYYVKFGLEEWDKRKVALGILKEITDKFESAQTGIVWSWTNSGNGEEDRPSNLIGFYRAVRGFSKYEIENVVHPRTKWESLCLWDGIGGLKTSTSWKPTDYNPELESILSTLGSPEVIPALVWPAMLNTIIEEPKGANWRNWQ